MMKRMLSALLTLCLIMSVVSPSATAVSTWWGRGSSNRENVLFELLDGNPFDLNLFGQKWNEELKIEKIDDDQEVRIFIVMDSLSVVQTNSKAVYGPETQAAMEALQAEQQQVLAKIQQEVLGGEALEVNYSYTWLLNGVAVQVPYGMIEKIRQVAGVKQVLLQPKYEVCKAERQNTSLFTATSGPLTGREEVWADGYTGRGIKIAVIDTGLDDDHPNFAALPEEKLTAASYGLSDIEALLPQLNATVRFNEEATKNHTEMLTADGLYRSSKVIFGFNYADNNLNITHDLDTMGDHGTHVSGIAAANKIDGSEVVGVAPDAQLYIMKVYGADHGGYAEDILAALEDALLLGADVVNMSLGTNAGFTTNTAEVNAIYNRVSETNTVLSVAAGNNYTSGFGNTWGVDQNQTMYPDNAVISQPGVYANVLSVASIENTYIQRRYIAAGERKLAFIETSLNYGLPSIDEMEDVYGLVSVPGYGEAADFEGLDVSGKIALVQRGGIAFMDKCQNAQDAGAVACIVYNNDEGEFGMDLTGATATIPCISVKMEDGEYLLQQLEQSPDFTISFPKDMTPMLSPYAGMMSDFSSWGVAPDLSLEPDITAPGGNIYSTVNNGEYGMMSGTSMATPNISGMTALVMQYLRENNIETEIPIRELVQHLLVSTAAPVVYAENGLYYSPRHQGGGLGNALQAITTTAYLSVEGKDTPKAELGDDPDKTGKYSFSYQVHNFGNEVLYYYLDTVVQTEGVTAYEQYPDRLFMSGVPESLSAKTSESSKNLVITHDISQNGLINGYDAYLLYQQTLNQDYEENERFRSDMTGDGQVNMDDVQDYLNALVGLESQGDLEEKVLKVKPGKTATVKVSVTLKKSAKEYLDTYFPNGGYVEGFTFLNAVNGTDLSLAYLGFYGDWDAAPVLDDGFYWEVMGPAEEEEETEEGTEETAPENAEVVGNQYVNVLWTEMYGVHAAYYPGLNPYVEEEFDVGHISISPNGDGFVDTIDDIYVSLLRNARYLTFRYIDADTGEVYYDQTTEFAAKSVYVAAYGQIIPAIYSWMGDKILTYNFTGSDGHTLPNNTHLKLQVEAVGDYEGATPDTWEVPITVDLQAPELLQVEKVTDEEGKVWLEMSFRDNLSVAAVVLMNSNGEETYYVEGTTDGEFDENGYRNYTARFDITDISGKLSIVVADYALNEAQYALNVAGAGTAYGDLVGYQYNIHADTTGWVAFSEGVNQDEVQITLDAMEFVAAEYVNGFIFAQTETGALYGFHYADMLADRVDIENTYITQLENTYHDLAYNYVTGELYGLIAYEEADGYPSTEIYTINIWGTHLDEATGETVEAYAETWKQGRGGLYGLGITVDTDGTIYLLGTNDKGKTELWASYESSFGVLFKKAMSLDAPMDYAQSITYDHNTGNLYWGQFYADSIESFRTELYKIDVAAGTYESVGTLSGETCGMFAPLTAETVASNPIYQNVPEMDPNIVGMPMLRKTTVNMNVGAMEMLLFDFDPWYTAHREVIWSSSDENVVTVTQDGLITAVGTGTATITVTNAADEGCFDTLTVTVTELTLEIEGIISNMGAGVGNSGGAKLYKYVMEKSIASMIEGSAIYAPDDLNFGLDIATSVYARGYIWACEYGNTGMIYQIDPTNGEVVDVLMPIDGDMIFGLTYNEQLDTFTGIMNMYLFVDLQLTHEEQEEMLGSYDESTGSFNYHRLNMLEYLRAAGGNFVTGETGQGASSEIVMCGVTTITDSFHFVDTGKDFLGNDAMDEVHYNSTQTLVVLDNVGRLWYIDEICGLTKTEDMWSVTYTSETDEYTYISAYTGSQRSGIIELDNGDGTYNVFYIRSIEETPLTDMFLQDAMPRITYHFSDIEFGGYTADGAPIFAMSLYDYWNNGTTNELYLYVPELTRVDEATGEMLTVSAEKFYHLGSTGQYNIIASIHAFRVLGGLDD